MLRRIFYTIVMCVFVVGGCYAIENEEGFSNGDEQCQIDNHGCNSDGTIENSCYGMGYSVSGVFNGTAGCMTRDDVNQSRAYITNTNWGNSYKQYNSFCFCSQDQECSGGSVEVIPCGNDDTACASGYHWVSGSGCVQQNLITCTDCNTTDWGNYSTGVQRRVVTATCDGNTGSCSKTTVYRCAANYYSTTGKADSGDASALGCAPCSNVKGTGATSPAGSTSANACIASNNNTPNQSTCTASKNCGSWTSTGSFEYRKCTIVSENCSKVEKYEYRCGAGYYPGNAQAGGVLDSANGLKCTKCPKIDNVQSTSDAGGADKSACCIKSGDTGEDETGPFVIESKCCATL